VKDVAKDVAEKLIEDFGRQKGEGNFITRAPKKTRSAGGSGYRTRAWTERYARQCIAQTSALTMTLIIS